MNDQKYKGKRAQNEFTRQWNLNDGSLTTEVLNDEPITLTVRQTIGERDEQERASDLKGFKSQMQVCSIDKVGQKARL